VRQCRDLLLAARNNSNGTGSLTSITYTETSSNVSISEVAISSESIILSGVQNQPSVNCVESLQAENVNNRMSTEEENKDEETEKEFYLDHQEFIRCYSSTSSSSSKNTIITQEPPEKPLNVSSDIGEQEREQEQCGAEGEDLNPDDNDLNSDIGSVDDGLDSDVDAEMFWSLYKFKTAARRRQEKLKKELANARECQSSEVSAEGMV